MLPKFEKSNLNGIVTKFRSMSASKGQVAYAPMASSPKGQVAYSPTAGAGSHDHTLEDIMALIQELDRTGFVAPFDWIQWSNTLPPGWQTNPALIATADVETLRRLMTAHIRLDRMNRGHLDGLFRSGYMDQVFHRLEALAPKGL
jgi:hypothetical protein